VGAVVIVLGIPGVGKSTVSKRVQANLSSVIATDFADHMLDDESLRDTLQYLSIQDRRPLFEIAKARISKMVSEHDGTMLLEAHIVLRVQGEIRNLGLSLFDLVRPSDLVLVDAPAEVILDRRRTDIRRARQVETVESLRELQVHCYLRALQVSFSLGVPLSLIANQDLESSVKRLADVLSHRNLL